MSEQKIPHPYKVNGSTPRISLRMPKERWERLRWASLQEGTTATAIINELVEDYLSKRGAA